MKSTDKKEKDMQKYKNSNAQTQTQSFQNLQQIDMNSKLSDQIESAMHNIGQEIILLTKKRENSDLIFY